MLVASATGWHLRIGIWGGFYHFQPDKNESYVSTVYANNTVYVEYLLFFEESEISVLA